ncbi:RagB/SusD family nutrient uptake outer membrane protein [Dysgonomonas termitidis]
MDIIPDNVATMDHAFSNTIETEKYLFTCYNYIPDTGDIAGNIGLLAGDEIWIPEIYRDFAADNWSIIARGRQNKNSPTNNYWSGFNQAKPLFVGIRHCNIFLENVENMDKIHDLPLDKRRRWIAEVKFLKAYYHFYLLRMYGPIPIADKNLPMTASKEQVKVKRRPVDECVNYIAGLLDESYADLPRVILNTNDELGRITKSVNRAIKARLLLLSASPLFNGNTDYADFKNKDGELLFNTTYDPNKWKMAADAAKEAIDEAELAEHKLYYYTEPKFQMTDTTMIQMSIRGAVTERWNDEVIWGLTNGLRTQVLQKACMPLLNENMGVNTAYASLAPPLKIVKEFYSFHGVPIEEDKLLNFKDMKALRIATPQERVNFEVRYETARINYDRENRFYACIGFDGGKWLTADLPQRVDYEAYTVKAKAGQISAGAAIALYSVSGYYTKKLVNWESTFTANSSIKEYAWPEIRLADVYLMYAEALNEAEGPVEDVHKYLDLIRKRAGLESIKDSWTKYSNNPAKPTTKEGMREIIHRERNIEMSFEGIRFWDMKRWKKAVIKLNEPITGWDINQKDAAAYYQEKTIFQQKFIAPRDYLWPLAIDELTVNSNLVQNPGW